MSLPVGTTLSQLGGVGGTPEEAVTAVWDEAKAALGETPWEWASSLDVAAVRSDDGGTILAWVATGIAVVTGEPPTWITVPG